MPQRPYGNDFLVATPALDQLGQRLYMEEKQRQLQNQANIKSLDDEFSKNVSNIRDADVEDFTKAYQDYKMSAQNAMRQKGGIPPQQQLEILRKKASLYKLMNESKSEKEREELDAKRYSIKPDDFNDDAPQYFVKGRQLPLSQKRAFKSVGADGKEVVIDLTNPEFYRWQDKTNWQPILEKASGTLTQRGQPVVVDLPGGLEQEITTYKGGNSPIEYFQGIMGAMTKPRDAQSLANRYNFTPEEAQDIMLKFDELKKTPAFKNAYGDVKFPESASLSQGGKTAMLLAMTNALNNPPVANAPIRKTNKEAVMDRNEKLKLKYAAVQDSYIRGRQRMVEQNPGLQKYDVLGLYYGKAAPAVKKVKVGGGMFPKYEEVTEYRVPATEVAETHKTLFGKVRPYTDDSGKKYYVVREDGDWEGEDGQVISRYAVATEKQGKTTLSEEKRGVPDMNQPGTRLPRDIKQTRMQPKSYNVGGKTFTQDQIDKAAKKYNMTVEQYLKSIGVQ